MPHKNCAWIAPANYSADEAETAADTACASEHFGVNMGRKVAKKSLQTTVQRFCRVRQSKDPTFISSQSTYPCSDASPCLARILLSKQQSRSAHKQRNQRFKQSV